MTTNTTYPCGNETKNSPTQGYPDDNPKTLLGVTKVPLHLVPPSAKHFLAEAFADGAVKYGPFNWRDKTVSSSVYMGAACRHIDAWWDGEDFASDSGKYHLAHAMACMAVVLDAMTVGRLNDDRPTKGAASELQQSYVTKDTPTRKKESKEVDQSNPPTNTTKEYNEAVKRPAVREGSFDPLVHRWPSNLQANVCPSILPGKSRFIYGDSGGEWWYDSHGRVVRYDTAGNRVI